MLRLKDVRVNLGDFQLKNITLNVKSGEYMVLLGPTGTGKTVLLETISGIHPVGSGSIFIHGRDATHLPPEKRNLGVVYQDYALFPHLTVRKNIAFGLGFKGIRGDDAERAVNKIAGFLDIRSILERHPDNLSGGERQRVALARALVLDPYVLLLDEPLSALDRLTRDRLKRELKRIHQETGVTILHITHDLSEAFFLADHLAVMRDGEILQVGSPEAVLKSPANRTVAQLLGIENLIPGKIGPDGKFVSALGLVDIPISSGASIKDDDEEVYLTIPAWCVELLPVGDGERYAWKGKMKVIDIDFMDAVVELELAHPGGLRLRTCLSRRELGHMVVTVQIGAEVTVGILKEGACCVPR